MKKDLAQKRVGENKTMTTETASVESSAKATRKLSPPAILRRENLILATVLAAGVVLFQHVLHEMLLVRSDAPLLTHLPHVARDILLALPLALIAVEFGSNLSRVVSRRSPSPALRATLITQVFMLLMIPAVPVHGKIDEFLGAGHALEGSVFAHGVRDALIGQVAALPLLIAALFLMNKPREAFVDAGFGLPTRATSVRMASAVLVVSGLLVAPNPVSPVVPAAAAIDADGCDTNAVVRSYDVSAINIDMVLNRFGDHDPDGFMYVLDNRIADVRAQEAAGTVTSGLRQDPIQALVIRANVGDCLEVNFTNRLNSGEASFHVYGLAHTATNAGGNVGLNPSTNVAPNDSLTYRFPIPTDPVAEGTYQFHSRANDRFTLAHGLFGSLIVEPAGSTYLDPEDATQTIESGWEAIIRDPNGIDFREFVIMMHEVGDENYDILDVNDNPLPVIDDQLSGTYRPGSRALNYRSEPFMRRLELDNEKSLGYSSYSYGDPSTPIPRSYLGEPTKTRLTHPGSEMFHVYHLHGGGTRWRRNPRVEVSDFATGLNKVPVQDAQSTRLDSQSAGPGESYDLEHECGAGGCQQAAGDFLFHCHIGQHYISGMWSFWRVFDTTQPDLAVMPSDPGYVAPDVEDSGTSLDLIGAVVEGMTLVPAVDVDQPNELAIEDFIADQLPPQGVTLDNDDATVWDWDLEYVNGDPTMPLFLGEPNDTNVWANYDAGPEAGQRPELLFNLGNGRRAWPIFEPHLGKRPPFAPNGHSGAPWLGEEGTADRPDGICPSTDVVPQRRWLNYPLSAIDLELQITPTFSDPNGMLYALNEDIDGIRNGTKPAEPIVLRSNVGDCVKLLLTSEQEDVNHEGNAKVNLHSHFTQFDPQASDGVITGYSYEQSIYPYAEENRTLSAAPSIGATDVSVTNVNRLRVGISIGVGLGEGMCDPTTGAKVPVPVNSDRPCTEIFTIAAINGTTITLDAPIENEHLVGEAVGVEFVQAIHYSDVDSGTVFFHDHVKFQNWDHGLIGAHIVEPAGSTWHDPETGAEIRTGTTADIHVPSGAIGTGANGSFREFMAFVHDSAKPVDPADPLGELNVASLNLNSNPLADRDKDFPFSSVTNDDPFNVFRAYLGDPVVIRGLAVMEREGSLRLTGHRFQEEPGYTGGALTDSIDFGISEREDLLLETGAGGEAGQPGDFLLYNGFQRNLDGGGWGILRVHNTLQGDLQPLPDRNAPNGGAGFPTQTFTGGVPTRAPFAGGNSCPGGAPVKSYDVSLLENVGPLSLTMFSLTSDAAAYTAGTKQLEPLVLRVNEGDCLEILLANTTGDPAGISMSNLLHDVQASAGTAVGFNLDSRADRDETKRYRFFADKELGTSLFYNVTNPRSMLEGAFGAVIVEPAGATYRNPADGLPVEAGVTADIMLPTGSFREQVLLMHDEDDQIGSDVMPYRIAVQGFTGFNYQSDPLINGATGRLDLVPDPGSAYDSAVHGDPNLVLNAYVGDPVRLRVGVGAGEQSHAFAIDGHRFSWEETGYGFEQLTAKGVMPGTSFDATLKGGAGGGISSGADYMILDRRMPFLEAGMWGIMRTHGAPISGLLPLEPYECNGAAPTVDLNLGQSPTEGNDVIFGTPGNDTIDGLGGDDLICGEGGADIIDAGDGNDIVFGGAGDDQISGGNGGDQLIGDDGADIINGDGGGDYVFGGAGNDLINGGDNPGVTNEFPNGTIDILEGGPGDDIINGGRGNDLVIGHDGNDTLIGGEDDDYLWGGLGIDSFEGGLGRDYLDGGDDGEDIGEIMDGGEGDDIILGHGGDDILIGGPANGDGSDYLWGGAGVDNFNGGDSRDTLDGGDEGEIMDGGAGDDDILGHGGDDTLRGGAGGDYIWGGAGIDSFDGGDGADFLDGGFFFGPSDESETMDGGADPDQIYGMGGNDILIGGTHDDYLVGGAGDDDLDGGDGSNDICDDGTGTNTFTNCEVILP